MVGAGTNGGATGSAGVDGAVLSDCWRMSLLRDRRSEALAGGRGRSQRAPVRKRVHSPRVRDLKLAPV